MDIDLSRLIDSAMPDRGRRTVGIISQNGSHYNDTGFLSSDFPKSAPKLYITSEEDDFDVLTLSEWKNEGFNVEYISMGNGGSEYRMKLDSLNRTGLGPCETYGIIAYGDAASSCLEYFHVLDNNREFKLGCLIAYYPTRIPDPRTKFPSNINVLVHLPSGGEVGVVKQNQIVGLQGRKRTTKRTIERGSGTGKSLNMAYPSYSYDATPGFAEHDLDEYEKVSAELAWSRSLATARRAFRRDINHETVLEQNMESKFYTRNLQQAMSTYTTHKVPHVTYMPTLTGGIGVEELQRFYSEFFMDRNPPSMKLTLLSRTIGADRVVDEMHVSFKHTQEIPWILPGVPATNKRVEIILVSIVTLRGGKLHHEHVYWDQASVLVQVGLLDRKLIPQKAKDRGVKRLPVVGREAARNMLKGIDDEEDGEASNDLIPEWYDDEDEEATHNEKQEINGTGAAKEKQTGKKPVNETWEHSERSQERHPESKPQEQLKKSEKQTEERSVDQPEIPPEKQPEGQPEVQPEEQLGQKAEKFEETSEKKPEEQPTEQVEEQPKDQPTEKEPGQETSSQTQDSTENPKESEQ
ncbi:NTF2-like protein [Whalleya microplaca]|nr:NTF2-like protein [Whalleya microplaca]